MAGIITELASTNSIAKPYTIYAGQKIDIANPRLVKKSAKAPSVGKIVKT